MRKTLKKRRGFTLVELMVATSIMIVLIMFVTNIAVSMLRAYDNTVTALTANSDARSVLDPLESDLSSAMTFDDSHCWFEVRYDGENDLGNLEEHAAPQIMLFSQTSDRTRRSRSGGATSELPGELCAVRYALVQKSPFGDNADSPENRSYTVYRAVLNTKDTLEIAVPYIVGAAGKTGGSPEKQKPSEFWKSGERITDPSDEKQYSPKDWATQIQNFLIDGVVDITLIFWYDDFSDGKRKIAVVNNPDLVNRIRDVYNDYDVNTFNDSICAGAGKVVFDDNFSGAKSGALRSVDISVTVLGSEGKDALLGVQRQKNSGKIDEEKFAELLLEHGTTFSRSISLFSK
jgi:prepilin-type N-terminal cleavage/methylation domain-containing protein